MELKGICSVILLSITLISCNTTKKESTLNHKNSLVQFSKNFSISIEKGGYALHLINPENNTIEKKYFLTKSKKTSIPEGYTKIQIPIQSTIALSSTHIGMLNKLKSCDLVKGISNHIYVHEPSILERYHNGEVIEMGDENSIPVESIIKSKANLLIYSGFGKKFPHEEQLEKIGIICMANYDWRENHPLGKAEWIKVFGYLTGKEKQADNYFKHLTKEYFRLIKIAKKAKTAPTLFSGNLVGDTWFSPAGESYNAILFKDANGDYKYKNTKGTGSTENSFEQIFKDNVSTEYWFNPGMASNKDLLLAQPKFQLFQSYQKNKIYSYTFSGNEFWERSAIEPHHVLSDLIHILHPELKLKNKLYFYRTLDK